MRPHPIPSRAASCALSGTFCDGAVYVTAVIGCRFVVIADKVSTHASKNQLFSATQQNLMFC